MPQFTSNPDRSILRTRSKEAATWCENRSSTSGWSNVTSLNGCMLAITARVELARRRRAPLLCFSCLPGAVHFIRRPTNSAQSIERTTGVKHINGTATNVYIPAYTETETLLNVRLVLTCIFFSHLPAAVNFKPRPIKTAHSRESRCENRLKVIAQFTCGAKTG